MIILGALLPSLILLQGAGSPAIVGATILNPEAIVLFTDYPQAALQRGEQGRTSMAITIDPSGNFVSCAITQSSGSRVLDDTGCRLVKKRARFRPATIDGVAVHGRLTTATSFMIPRPGTIPKSQPSFDGAIAVDKLPPGVTTQSIKIDQRVEVDGTVSACAVANGSGAKTLDAAVCRHAQKQPGQRILGASDAPVRGVASYTIAVTQR